MARRSKSARTRVSVAVAEHIRTEAPAHPELAGLPRGTSRSKVFARLLELGWEAALRAQREREQRELYEAYARDPERRAAARAEQRALLRSGVV